IAEPSRIIFFLLQTGWTSSGLAALFVGIFRARVRLWPRKFHRKLISRRRIRSSHLFLQRLSLLPGGLLCELSLPHRGGLLLSRPSRSQLGPEDGICLSFALQSTKV